MSRKPAKTHASHERWLVSYADFITLLFAFFVVLYASSQADKKKQAELSGAIDSAFRSLGLFPSPAKQKTAPAAEVDARKSAESLGIPEATFQDFMRIRKHLESLLAEQLAAQTVSIHIGHEGLVISLREAGFFDSGSAVPHPESMEVLRHVSETLVETPYDIRVEGHTDNVPIHTSSFQSNWELSTARATTLAKFLIVNQRFTPGRLSASGYAEFHPVGDNGTLGGRAENRRVDIIVLPRISPQQAAEPVNTTSLPPSPPAKSSPIRPAP